LSELVAVAGEPSGDRAAAHVVARLRDANVAAFGVVGPACEAEGAVACARVTRAAMGALDVAARGLDVARAMLAVRRAIDERAPRAALLVNYTDFNARLLGFLRRRGVRVLWYAAPQIWAWRASRGDVIGKNVDAMAVVLPFEEELWRACGARARYVGHPAMEIARLARGEARKLLGIARDDARAIAILPGSRTSEVRRLLAPMLAALAPHERDAARVIATSALDGDTLSFMKRHADAASVRVHEVDASYGAISVLEAFDAALCASGTASLECAIANVPPVVAYALDPLAAFVARRALRTPHVALPNVLLGRRVFPELLQREANADAMRRALDTIELRAEAAREDCAEVRRVLGGGHEPSRAVAEMLTPWLT
jgi:lipid-A-disaccharide synthase